MAPSPQARRFVFTINNPTDEDCEAVLSLVPICKYLIAADEVGESGTPHIQGYVVFGSAWRKSKLSRILRRAFIDVARGTSAQCAEYCKKGGKYEEYGELPVDTRFTSEQNSEKWSRAFDLAKSGRLDEIDPELRIRYFRCFDAIYDQYRPRPQIKNSLYNLWIWGGTGTGKTRWVFQHFPDHYNKLKNKWWDGYNGESVVCMQEVGPKHEMLSEHIKEWADHYPFRCEKKGSSCVIVAKVLIITSNYSPEQIWTESEILEPINRRFQVFNFPFSTPSDELVQEIREFIA